MRTHGGAIAPAPPTDRSPPSSSASDASATRSAAIGSAAAALIADGESIAFDASTTALYVARHLKDAHDLALSSRS